MREQRVRQLIEETGGDHRELLAQVRSVETLLEGPMVVRTGDLARRLTSLANDLEEHAVEEEASAFFKWLPNEFPHLKLEIDALLREHKPMLSALREQAERAEGSSNADIMSQLSIDIRATVATLRQHEATESALLQRALKECR